VRKQGASQTGRNRTFETTGMAGGIPAQRIPPAVVAAASNRLCSTRNTLISD